MTTLRSELQGVIARHLALAPAHRLPAIIGALAEIEDRPQVVSVLGHARPVIAPRFEIVDDDIVIDHSTGLTWLRGYVPGGRRSYDESMKAAAAFSLRDWQWRAPTIQERLSINDYERHNPAIDTSVFRSEPSGWEWTATVDHESPSGCAWIVYFDDGDSFRGGRGNGGFVRAVRVGQ